MRICVDPRVARQVIDGTAFLVSPWDHRLHTLNHTGTFLWSCIEKNMDSERIVKRLMDEFDVPPEQARQDVISFVDQLIDQGLIHRVRQTA